MMGKRTLQEHKYKVLLQYEISITSKFPVTYSWKHYKIGTKVIFRVLGVQLRLTSAALIYINICFFFEYAGFWVCQL